MMHSKLRSFLLANVEFSGASDDRLYRNELLRALERHDAELARHYSYENCGETALINAVQAEFPKLGRYKIGFSRIEPFGMVEVWCGARLK